MEYEVDITDVALAEKAYLWMIEQLSPENAEKWFDGLIDTIESLNKSPKSCSLALENEDFLEEIRQLLYGKGCNTYPILFTVSEQVVYVLHIRHSPRQLLKP
ncbi:MAG: type II toxin-antitoxin system RelE/ParE family toxin [Trichodesmium sp. St19_bin1]|jgi:Plasmid stabilization system protein|nr:type II toxin-antitoxin system RelE/ParE family toxin [Trichodesmium sp. St19_bin1]